MKLSQSSRSSPKSSFLSRLLVVYGLVALWGVVLVGRLIHLQVFNVEEYRHRAGQQQSGFVELKPKRGDVLDRNLDDLAISLQMDSVFAHPKDILDPVDAARLLAPVLEQPHTEVYRRLISDRPFVYLARKVTPRQASQIAELRLPGISFQKESQRVYPGRELAAHVLGFVGMDNQGLSGLEYLYEEQLKGQPARLNLRVDARRQSFTSEAGVAATDGNTVILNLDRTIQYLAEQVLQETVESARALDGSAIVLDPQTGEILAMASYPTFNPNRYSAYHPEVHRNRAILEIYEPGSTFKVMPLSAVLNEGLAELDEIIDCRVGTLRLAGKVYREARHSYGFLSFREVVAKSSNVGTIKLGLRLGNEKLYEYIRRFGFGEKTGVELPGEQTGLLRPLSQWSRISIGALSIGQELGATPIQMVRAFSVLANGGYLVQPRLVRRIVSPQGEVIFESEPVRERILSPRAAALQKETLALVVDVGTGRTARLNGYSSAGKTGTAQKFIDGRYSRTRFVASYVGFAPLEDPALAAIIVINEPQGLYYGGQVAAPAFKRLMERCLMHLKVPPDQPLPPPARLPQAASRGSMELPGRAGLSGSEEEPPLERLEETLLSLMQPSEEPRPGPAVTIKTGWFHLPDFSGMSLRQVAQECAGLGLQLKVSGSGVAVGQRPPPGSAVFRDSVCEVFFSTEGQAVHATQSAAFTGEGTGRDPGGP